MVWGMGVCMGLARGMCIGMGMKYASEGIVAFIDHDSVSCSWALGMGMGTWNFP